MINIKAIMFVRVDTKISGVDYVGTHSPVVQ